MLLGYHFWITFLGGMHLYIFFQHFCKKLKIGCTRIAPPSSRSQYWIAYWIAQSILDGLREKIVFEILEIFKNLKFEKLSQKKYVSNHSSGSRRSCFSVMSITWAARHLARHWRSTDSKARLCASASAAFFNQAAAGGRLRSGRLLATYFGPRFLLNVHYSSTKKVVGTINWQLQ